MDVSNFEIGSNFVKIHKFLKHYKITRTKLRKYTELNLSRFLPLYSETLFKIFLLFTPDQRILLLCGDMKKKKISQKIVDEKFDFFWNRIKIKPDNK